MADECTEGVRCRVEACGDANPASPHASCRLVERGRLHQLDAPVLGPSLLGIIGHHWLGFPEPLGSELTGIDPEKPEVSNHGLGPALRELQIVSLRALVVGMTLDLELQIRILLQQRHQPARKSGSS